jgi:hypothetical protein
VAFQRTTLDATAAKTTTGGEASIKISGTVGDATGSVSIHVYLNGKATGPVRIVDGIWEVSESYCDAQRKSRLNWSLEPGPSLPIMVLVTTGHEGTTLNAKLLWV